MQTVKTTRELEPVWNSTMNMTQPISDPASSNDKIKVAVRVRPFLKKDFGKDEITIVGKDQQSIQITDGVHIIQSKYSKVFGNTYNTQEEIYEFAKDSVAEVLNGFNCTIFAYGQTGSGKTYTMFGPQWEQPTGSATRNIEDFLKKKKRGKVKPDVDFFNETEYLGIIPRAIEDTFHGISKLLDTDVDSKYTVYCSFLQIYNEKLYDLLQDNKNINPLNIREDKYSGIYVEGLTEYVVTNTRDCFSLLRRGERNRVTRQTSININSSRSHSIFQLLVETDTVDKRGMLKRAKLNLCDLAGSEKINKDEEMESKHLLELKTINLSLTWLGKCISSLSKNSRSNKLVMHSAQSFKKRSKNGYVPYRESKLTRLLQDSLGGNTKTCLIATISPIVDCAEETISTLKFADRAKQVMSSVKANEVNASDDALVQKLQKEVQHLREVLNIRRKGKKSDIEGQLMELKNENIKLREIASNAQEVERLKLENKIMKLELQRMRVDSAASQNRKAGSEISTDMTNGKLKEMQNSSITKPPIYKNSANFNVEPPERCPLWDSYPPCAHYQAQSDNMLKSWENPLSNSDEETKGRKHDKPPSQKKSKFSSSKKVPQRLASDPELGKIGRNGSVPREFEGAIQETRKPVPMNSYVEPGFVSPKSNSGSISVPFNFTSDNSGYERSSIYNRSNRLAKVGASILGGSGLDRKTTVRIRGKQQTETIDGTIDHTLEQQKKLQSKKKEIRLANERLKTLEKLEKYRQEKVKEEIEQLEEERKMEEITKENKRKEGMLKRRRIAQQKREIQQAKEERERSKRREQKRKEEKEIEAQEVKEEYFKQQKHKIQTYREKQRKLENDLKSENLI